MFVIPAAGWQRVAVAALLIIPLVLVVVLLSPGLILLPFLSGERREAMLRVVDRFIDWAKVATGVAPPPDDRPALP